MKTINIFNLLFIISTITGCATTTFVEGVHVPKTKDWKVRLAHDYGVGKGALIEYIPKNESSNNWSKIVSARFFEGNKELPIYFMRQLETKMKDRCTNTNWIIINEQKNSVIYEWSVKDCAFHSDYHELAILLKGNYGLHRATYMEKNSKLSKETREKWLKNLEDTYVQFGGVRITLNPD